jgi:hypothetical protein
VAQLESALAISPDDPVALAWLAHAAASSGASDRAIDLVARLRALQSERYVSGYHLALACVGLGDVDEAFIALDNAYVDRDPVLSNLVIDPRFAPLRDDDRYRRLLERINLGR